MRAVTQVRITNITSSSNGKNTLEERNGDDQLAVEEPLEIGILYGAADNREQKNISVTMCTPGNEEELATGFLFTEGIIRAAADVLKVHLVSNSSVLVELRPGITFDPQKLERHFYTSSSCGVCGKSSIDAVRNVINDVTDDSQQLTADATALLQLPEILRKQQEVFERTGGLHASALFDRNGKLLLLREDVGRHNALDKLVGAALKEDMLPLNRHILLLSGRASFELIQKAAMAGIKMVCAVGAPSSLAVEMAKDCGMTLVGFLRDNRFNIYSGRERVRS